jgi:hypothetical protein
MSNPQREAKSGELLFVLLFFVLAVLLLSQLPDQVKWFKKTKLAAQPALWPAISIVGMVVFGGGHLWNIFRKDDLQRERGEAAIWLRSIEFALWFMLYVVVVPITGYLLTTLVFAPLLAFRVGYRSGPVLAYACLMGLGTVLFFKTFLSVKIPGGMIYEYLPNAMRSFMIVYF